MADIYSTNIKYFNRGFLYAKQKPTFIPSHYNQINDNLWLCKEINHAFSLNNRICIFGLVTDVRNEKLSINIIANNLAKELDKSEEKFHIEGDFLCGRYVIIYKNKNNKEKIITDAAGMRPIYHSKTAHIITGHAKLLADNISKKIGNIKMSVYAGGCSIGRTTPYPNVYLLIPNNSLEIDTGIINRFFPRKPFEKMNVETATNFVEKCVINAIKGITMYNKPLLISLTAGIDSRSTLSISTNIKHPIACFTYNVPNNSDVKRDVDIAKKICKELNVPHEIVQCSNNIDKNILDIFNANTYYSHNRPAYDALNKKFNNNYIHLRSNLIEIGRTFGSFRNVEILDTEDWLFPFFMKQNRNKKLNDNDFNIVKENLREYAKTTNLNKKSLHQYRASDMYYWEQRMATWMSQVLIDSDMAFNTFIPWNARCIFDAMFSIPYADRIKATILHNIISKNSPSIKNWPINK